VIHVRTRLTADFTVIANALAQRRGSAVTVGVAAYILSLPDGAPVGIAALCEHFTEGEILISRALKDLEQAGYLERRRERGPGGRIRTRTFFHDLPGGEGPDLPPPTTTPRRPRKRAVQAAQAAPARMPGPESSPSTGPAPGSLETATFLATIGSASTTGAGPAPAPLRPPVPEPSSVPGAGSGSGSGSGSVPVAQSAPAAAATPVPASAPAAAAAAGTVSAPAPCAVPPPAPASAPAPAPAPDSDPRAVVLLTSLRLADARLILSRREVTELAPAVTQWLAAGVGPAQITELLTAGLPDRLRARPARILAFRLGDPPLAAPNPAPLPGMPDVLPWQTCDGGCERAFRAAEPGCCRDCRAQQEAPRDSAVAGNLYAAC
jgi:hypothetical protein